MMCHGVSERTGKLAGIAAVAETDDILLITTDGTIIRTPVSGIPFYGRSAGGVIVMRLDEGASIVNFAKVENEDETEKAVIAAERDELAGDVRAADEFDEYDGGTDSDNTDSDNTDSDITDDDISDGGMNDSDDDI